MLFRFYVGSGLLSVFTTLVVTPVTKAQDMVEQQAREAGNQQAEPRGEEKSGKTKVLELGAKVLQGNAPMGGFDIYIVGFHPMKDHPEHQMTAHHFCNQVNEDFAQCVLFDGNTADANLNGIEYIISE